METDPVEKVVKWGRRRHDNKRVGKISVGK